MNQISLCLSIVAAFLNIAFNLGVSWLFIVAIIFSPFIVKSLLYIFVFIMASLFVTLGMIFLWISDNTKKLVKKKY